MSFSILNRVLFIGLILIIPAIYIVLWGRFGWSSSDDGFILGYSWRLISGEIPYKDFIYARPPLSIFLHALWFWVFPEDFLYVGMRYIAALQIIVYSLLSSYLLFSVFDECRAQGLKNWLVIGLLGFWLSVSTFTPMPWHTIDGIFFAIISSYFLFKPGRLNLFLSTLAVFFALLAKQSFYPLIGFFAVYLLFSKRYKDLCLYFIFILALSAIVYGVMQVYGVWSDFLQQTTGSTSIRDALFSGGYTYIKNPLKIILITALIVALLKVGLRIYQKEYRLVYGYQICLVVSFGVAYHLFKKQHSWVNSAEVGFGHVLFLASLLFLLDLVKAKRYKQVLTVALLMAIAWCSSISWGFPTPILLASPLLAAVYLMLYGERNFIRSRRGEMTSLLIGVFAIGLITSYQPYSDSKRRKLTCDLGQIQPKLSYIVTTEKNCNKVIEATNLIEKYRGGTVSFLPSFTASYFIFDMRNPLPLDWPLLAEMGGASGRQTSTLNNDVDIVIMDREEGDGMSKVSVGEKYSMPSVVSVLNSWKLMDKGKYYDVYKNPSK